MDLKNFELQDVGEIRITDSNGDPTNVVWKIAGPAHPMRVEFERKQASRGLREFNRAGKAVLSEDPDKLFDQETDRLVALSLGWDGIENNGEAVPFSPDMARQLLSNRALVFRIQVSVGLGKIENFSKPASTS
jgi:hypothetical protein